MSQAPISLAQSGTTGYGAVSAASTGDGTPTTGAGLAIPAVVLLLGIVVLGIGLFLRRTTSQLAS
ncbi:MAG: hypothetical protein ACRENY_08250 [Candidatus Dormibacteria bacterium]